MQRSQSSGLLAGTGFGVPFERLRIPDCAETIVTAAIRPGSTAEVLFVSNIGALESPQLMSSHCVNSSTLGRPHPCSTRFDAESILWWPNA